MLAVSTQTQLGSNCCRISKISNEASVVATARKDFAMYISSSKTQMSFYIQGGVVSLEILTNKLLRP